MQAHTSSSPSSPSLPQPLAAFPEQASGSAPLGVRYLLITTLPYYVDAEGEVWIDRLWHKDLLEHLPYLPKLTVAGPRWPTPPEGDLVKVERPEITFVPLPAMRSTLEGLRLLPSLSRALWQAIGDADIVHSNVVGWPFPSGWVANPIAQLRGKALVLVVESAPWRSDASSTGTRSMARQLRGVVTEQLARLWVNRGDVVFFTHEGYRASLLKSSEQERGHVIPATWIDDETIISDDDAAAAWAKKADAPVRALFAGRLVPEKGVRVLLEAAALLAARHASVQVSFVGEGPLAAEIRDAGLSLLPPVPYGPRFFALLRQQHVVIVPTLSDEQPRILYDAAAQAVSVIATDAPGNRALVIPGETGLLVAPNDPAALADALQADVARLRCLGMQALHKVRGHTHRAMHRQRWQVLARALAGRKATSPQPD